MPVGDYHLLSAEDGFKYGKVRRSWSAIALTWLEKIERETGYPIAHAGNGPEVVLGSRKLKVDGFQAATQTAFEFHGCFYHGCPYCCLRKDKDPDTEPHPYHPEKSYADVYNETLEKDKYIESLD